MKVQLVVLEDKQPAYAAAAPRSPADSSCPDGDGETLRTDGTIAVSKGVSPGVPPGTAPVLPLRAALNPAPTAGGFDIGLVEAICNDFASKTRLANPGANELLTNDDVFL